MGGIEPEKVIQILRDNGVDVNYKEACAIIDFLKTLAEIHVTQYLRGDGGFLPVNNENRQI